MTLDLICIFNVIWAALDFWKSRKKVNGEKEEAEKRIQEITLELDFRKKKSNAMDLEDKKSGVDYSLAYLDSLINFISARITDVPYENGQCISVRFASVLNNIDSIKANGDLSEAIDELGRIADIVVESLEMRNNSFEERNLER